MLWKKSNTLMNRLRKILAIFRFGFNTLISKMKLYDYKEN
jgi:hypothetical protein